MPILAQHRSARGFTMIEVLISIIVIAFGLLGIVGLQAFALKNNQSATFRSTATVLANDMIDRMHANPIGADVGAYDKPSAADYETGADLDCSAICTPEQLATRDRYEWEQLVKTTLPSGVGIVCRDNDPGTPACNGGNQFAVKISWTDDRVTTNTPTGTFTTQFVK
jgi:type IV pilus assembly protein PilV